MTDAPTGAHREPLVPGTIALTALLDRYRVAPAPGREIFVGRERPAVHLCLTDDDIGISRRHLAFRYQDSGWTVRLTGRREARVGRGRRLWSDDDPLPLDAGWTSLVCVGSSDRVHVVEVAIADADGWPRPRWADLTLSAGRVPLTDDELLVLAALGEPYLLDDPDPRPRSWHQVAERLRLVRPDGRLGARRVELLVLRLRMRLSAAGAGGFVSPDDGNPGDALKRNLIALLIASGSIGPRDLARLEPAD